MAKLECSWRVALISLVGVATSCQHAPAGSRPSTTSIAMPVVSVPPAVITSSAVVPPEPVQPSPIQSQADCPKDMVFIPEGDLSYTAAVPGKKDKTARAQHFHVRSFCIDRVEPQNRDWERTAPNCGKREDNCDNSTRSNQPLDCVTHEQAKCFCEHSPVGVRKRLPSDSEWLYAALGSDGRKFPWGNEVVPQGADERNFCVARDNVDAKEWLCTPAHNTMDRSPFGVLGMASNGWELNGTCISSEAKQGEACMGRHAEAVRNPDLAANVSGPVESFWLNWLSTRPVMRARPAISFRCATSERVVP
ncbi:MAG TPA: SUMF1/EgtB/PvdO family nonheme iron enzyme [Polyangiaceae bacterium]|nr:SUMF1/EgtB/PvdO family nonheme iron enzyme [Polyangiaceae bacterium]